MAEIKRGNGRTVVDYMARDSDSLLQAMRARIPELLPEWTGYASEADLGNVLLELFAYLGDILSYYQDRIANESFLSTAQTRRSIIHHLRLIGYRLATAAPASALLTLLIPVSKDDKPAIVTIPRGAVFATKSRPDQPSVRFEYTGEVAIELNCRTLPEVQDSTGRRYWCFGRDPFSTADSTSRSSSLERAAGIPVEEGRLISSERLGTSDGKPNQRFPLAHPRLILRPPGQSQTVGQDLTLLVEYPSTENGLTIVRWNLRETLAFSRTGALQAETEPQNDFVVEIDEDDRAVVIFGDGEFGAIPPKGALIKATYRTGGGVLGNVPERTITTIANAPQLALLGAHIMNLGPATGGAEREGIAHAVLQAPSVFRARKRAVTKGDYEALARSFRGVGKVRAQAANWNTVTLNVAPEGGGDVSDTLRANLLAYFEDKRPITTQIVIAGVDYVPIYMTAEIQTEAYYDPEDVKARVQAAVRHILEFDQVDFGQLVYLSKFYEAIEAIEGIKSVYMRQFTRESATAYNRIEADGKIELGHNEIPQLPAAGIRIIGV